MPNCYLPMQSLYVWASQSVHALLLCSMLSLRSRGMLMLLFPILPGDPETEATALGAASGAENSGGQPVDGAPQVRPEQGAHNRQVRS
jgi:hypothetical protein